jgi:hypothetical protein
MTAKFFDYAKNLTNPAVAEAVAHVRRDAIADGSAKRVEANWPGGERFYWNGGDYDVAVLANELRRNNAENVVVE